MSHKGQEKSSDYSLRTKVECISVKIMWFLKQCRLPNRRYTQKALMWNLKCSNFTNCGQLPSGLLPKFLDE